tara:strand:- start:77 stop:367 length:291 start_codon:yes stop_codon:yes gene_type:complete
MNAQDLNKLSKTITNVEKLDIVYNELLIPLLKRKAERKQNELQVRDNAHQTNIYFRLQELGFSGNLQYLCRQEMMPYLIDKGFTVAYSCYSTTIKW